MNLLIPKKKSVPVLSFEQVEMDIIATAKALREYKVPRPDLDRTHFALHHSQVSSDPFNFFVIAPWVVGAAPEDIVVVVNPRINSKSDPMTEKEACMSFPFRHAIAVKRYDTINVTYQTVDPVKKELIEKTEDQHGIMARIFQHEIQHANGMHIYQNSFSH